MLTNVTHPIPPVFDADSRVLILGSFPSVKSRETGFFYGHPQNRFWKVIAAVFEEDIPKTIEEKKACLLRNHIAVWDVIRSCDIKGSSDASIKNVTANNLDVVLKAALIKEIFVNGKMASKYYQKYMEPYVGRPAICLPSTSPANAAWNMERLIEKWKLVWHGGMNLLGKADVYDNLLRVRNEEVAAMRCWRNKHNKGLSHFE